MVWAMASDGPKRHRGAKHGGEARTSPYPMSRLAPVHDLVDVAREIQQADQMIGSVVHGQLKVVVDQIRGLQEQARTLLEQARRDVDLHRARCNFSRRPGKVYHLYRRAEGELYFSMLAPEDWQQGPPHAFEGSYRLEADMSWTPLEQMAQRDAADHAVRGLLAPPSE